MKKPKIIFTKDLDSESNNASLNSNTKALKDLAEVEKEKLAVKDRVDISLKEYNELLDIKNYTLPFLTNLQEHFPLEKLKNIKDGSVGVMVNEDPMTLTERYCIYFSCDKHLW